MWYFFLHCCAWSFEFESYCMHYILYRCLSSSVSSVSLSLPLSLSLSTEAFCPFFLVAQPEKATSNALSRLQHLNVTKGDTDECPPLSSCAHLPCFVFSLSPRFPCTPTSSHTQPSLPCSHFSLSLSEDNRARWTEMALWVTQVGTSFSVCIRGRWDEWCSLCESPALLWHAIPPASISINPGHCSSNLNKCSCFSPCGTYCTLVCSIIWLGMMRF